MLADRAERLRSTHVRSPTLAAGERTGPRGARTTRLAVSCSRRSGGPVPVATLIPRQQRPGLRPQFVTDFPRLPPSHPHPEARYHRPLHRAARRSHSAPALLRTSMDIASSFTSTGCTATSAIDANSNSSSRRTVSSTALTVGYTGNLTGHFGQLPNGSPEHQPSLSVRQLRHGRRRRSHAVRQRHPAAAEPARAMPAPGSRPLRSPTRRTQG